jgi:uncharacterized membrane protein
MKNLTIKEGKTIAIISYITIIGTVIAFVMNNDKKNPFASFHIRQAIGIYLLFFLINLLTRYGYGGLGWIDNILYFIAFAFLVIGIVGAIQEEEKKIPFLGDQFQEWFKNIG